MVLSAHQPAYLPWLGYFHKMAHCDQFVIVDNVARGDKDFVTKNFVMGRDGKRIQLTIPVLMHGHRQDPILSLKMADQEWKVTQYKTLLLNYGQTEWLEKWRKAMENESMSLMHPLVFTYEIANELGIRTPVKYQSDLGIGGYKTHLIVNLCRHFGADTYLCGSEGFDAYGEELVKYGIKVLRQEFKTPDVPPLSVMHYLMSRGTEKTRKLIRG